MLTDWIHRLRSIFKRASVEEELGEELRFHLEREAERHARSGLPREEAFRRARLDLGGLDQVKEAHRDARGVRIIDDIGRDLAYAARQLTRSPGVGATVILSVGLAVGANTAIFSIVDAVLLRPLPYPDADRLVQIDGVVTRLPLRMTQTGMELAYPVSVPELREVPSFAHVGTYVVSGLNLGSRNPERLRVASVTPGFFAALGVTPAVGRLFTDADVNATDRIAVLSHHFWQRRFRSDRAVVGQSITLNGRHFSIAGVMPDGIDFPEASDVWIPPGADPQVASEVLAPAFVARLAPHVTPSSAKEQLLRLTAERPLTRQDVHSSPVTVTPLREALVGNVRPVLVLMVAAAVLVLLVACLNTSSLLLTRISAREREFAVRRALGAPRWRLARQVSCESLLLAAIAGMVAMPIAFWTLDVARLFIPAGLHGARFIAVDHRTFAAVAFFSLTAAALFGVTPSFSAQGREATPLRVSGSMTDARGWHRLRSALVITEIAIAVAVLIAATTLVTTVRALMAVDLGARNDTAVVMQVTLPRATYTSTSQIRRFYVQLRNELQQVPGVQTVGATSHLPGSSTVMPLSQPLTLEGRSLPDSSRPRDTLRLSATTGYFSSLGIDVLAGRAFTTTDRPSGPRTAIVSEGYARTFGLSPAEIVGRRVDVGFGGEQWAEVVGVVRDVRMRGPESDRQPALYVPFAQAPINATGFVVLRTGPDPRGIMSSIGSAVARVDASLPTYNVQRFGQVRSAYVATERFTMTTMVAFGSLAFGLATLGLYGIVSYLVRLRTREIAIRIAIGATSGMVRRQVIGSGVVHATAGIGLGLTAALGLWTVVAAYAPGLGHVEAAGVMVVSTVVFLVSTCAAWLPARRAARVDPLVALRSE